MWPMRVQMRLWCLGSAGLRMSWSWSRMLPISILRLGSVSLTPLLQVPVFLADWVRAPREFKSSVSRDPGRRQVRITPHRCTRAENCWKSMRESGRKREDGLDGGVTAQRGLRDQCKCRVCPFGLPGESQLKEPIRVFSTHLQRTLDPELARRPRADIPEPPKSVSWHKEGIQG